MVTIKSEREIKLMREASKLAQETLQLLGEMVRPGISTEEINARCHEYTLKQGATPAPLNYRGFPKSVCTSPNEVVCHGIPAKNVILKNGDIINIDVTSILNGFHGDTNRTFLVGKVKPQIKKLVEVAHLSLWKGINEVKASAYLGDIGSAIQNFAEGEGFSVVRDYCGHGIGRQFHEEPQILHYGERGSGIKLRPGMTFTIEPMINIGTHECQVLKDKWTVVTRDGEHSAQFEHTVLVTKEGCEVLTLWEDDPPTSL